GAGVARRPARVRQRAARRGDRRPQSLFVATRDHPWRYDRDVALLGHVAHACHRRMAARLAGSIPDRGQGTGRHLHHRAACPVIHGAWFAALLLALAPFGALAQDSLLAKTVDVDIPAESLTSAILALS